MRIRYIRAKGNSLDEMRENARKSDLAKHGDMVLAWVNEGDLTVNMFHDHLAAQSEPLGVEIGDVSDLYEP